MTNRKLQIALVVSLLLNLFLAGAVVGGAAWIKARQPMIAAGSLRIAGAELPAEQRRAFRAALRETRRSLKTTRQDEKAARTQAAALLRAPVLDQKALDAALARVRADDLTVRAALEQRAIAFAATLSPTDRARLAERMEHPNAGAARR
jgi:uncharacterized membrane protein